MRAHVLLSGLDLLGKSGWKGSELFASYQQSLGDVLGGCSLKRWDSDLCSHPSGPYRYHVWLWITKAIKQLSEFGHIWEALWYLRHLSGTGAYNAALMEDLCLVGGQVRYPSMSKMLENAYIWHLLPHSKWVGWDSSYVPVSGLVIQSLITSRMGRISLQKYQCLSLLRVSATLWSVFIPCWEIQLQETTVFQTHLSKWCINRDGVLVPWDSQI